MLEKWLNLRINTGVEFDVCGPALQGGNVMCLILSLFILHVHSSGSQQFCDDSADCSIMVGATCQNSECICAQPPDSPFAKSCPHTQSFGKLCNTDTDCAHDLICERDSKTCRCRRGHIWNPFKNACESLEDDHSVHMVKYDLVRDILLPTLIFASLALMAIVCYRLYCNRKRWRRGGDVARALEEAQLPCIGTSQNATWIAAYRFERSGPPCLLLPVGPPTYEEALKHKVILSSYHHHPPTASLVETTPL